MKNPRLFISVFLILACFAWTAQAREFNPAVIYQGNIEKNSFNVSIHRGVERFRKKTGLDCTETVAGLDMDDYFSSLRSAAEKGHSPVFLLYGNHIPKLVDFVRQYPATRFIVLDTMLDEPNMFSFVMAEHEGSFLAGALAALASTSKQVGFVSVVDTPFQRRFLCGYSQGAHYINPDIKIFEGFTGDYPGAWFDGKAVAALASDMMDKGADVIYQAAGGAGPAVLEAVAARGKLGIGVDINQNGLYPGSVLTSMIKRTDKAVFAALMLAKRGIWRDNYKRLGLAQDAIDIVFDRHNQSLVTPVMRDRIEKIRKDIVLGVIQVHNYNENIKCP